MATIVWKEGQVMRRLAWHSQKVKDARAADDLSEVVAEYGECDHLLDELLQLRPDLKVSSE
jgi:hypothetical protein